ncbi:MAG: type II secretion system protein GspG [Phycisphaerales bacterium]|nr:type II secretion system protein GspG [Phycisphaerales bacterium]
MTKHFESRRTGFTLLELMLVLAIIGVLMAVAAYNIVGSGTRAKIRVTKISMQTIEGALKTYYTEESAYPPSVTTLATVKPPILESSKLRDGWNQNFYYRVTGTQERPYELVSLGADGKSGTEDDIDVWKINQP